MNTKQTEALRLALSVLDEVRSETFRLMRNGQKLYAEEKVWNAIFVIKQALAEQRSGIKQVIEIYDSPEQPAQEPGAIIASLMPAERHALLEEGHSLHDALYTSPPASKPWVGLTDEEIKRMAAPWFLSMYWPLCNTFARAIEAKLKEKNGF